MNLDVSFSAGSAGLRERHAALAGAREGLCGWQIPAERERGRARGALPKRADGPAPRPRSGCGTYLLRAPRRY